MRMNMKPIVVAVACALAGACSTQPVTESTAQSTASAPSARDAGDRAPSTRSVSGDATKDASATAKRSVYYGFDEFDIKPAELATVKAHAMYLRDRQALKVRIEGNADERGSREYNLALGQKRADSVMKAMHLLGIPESRMESVSYGAEKPRSSGHDERSWSENRRSDIVYP
jgi:peptidoglycan-associated lipoprotein